MFETVATTDFSGQYMADAIPAGQYTVEVYAPGFATATRSIEIFDGMQTDADFQLGAQTSPGVLRGTIRDEDTDAPLAGVRVDLLAVGSIVTTAYSCANGQYELDLSGLKTIAVLLRFSADGFEEKTVEVNVEPGVLNEFDVFLTPKVSLPGAIVGVVRDSTTNAGIRGVEVVATLKGSRTGVSDRTTEDGEFLIPGVESGNYEMRASAPGFEGVEDEVTVFGIDPPAEITLLLDAEPGEGEGEGEGEGPTPICGALWIDGASINKIGDALILLLVGTGLIALRRRRLEVKIGR
jgi:hypothetical protein